MQHLRCRRTLRNPPLATLVETRALRRIAHAGGIVVTYHNGNRYFALRDGSSAPPARVIERLITTAALLPDDPGLLFPDLPQSYRVRRPADGFPHLPH